MSRKKCPNCGGKIPETLELCPACMEAAGAGSLEIEAAEELRDHVTVENATRKDAAEAVRLQGGEGKEGAENA